MTVDYLTLEEIYCIKTLMDERHFVEVKYIHDVTPPSHRTFSFRCKDQHIWQRFYMVRFDKGPLVSKISWRPV